MKVDRMTKVELIKEISGLRRHISSLERKSGRLEKLLKEIRQEFDLVEGAVKGWKRMIDSSKSIILLIGRDFRIKRTNRAGAEFLGKGFREMLGSHCSELFLDADISVADCLIEKVKKTMKHEEAEVYLPKRDKWMLVTVDPVTDDRGELDEIAHVTYDITDRKRLEERLKKSERNYRNLVDYALVGIYKTRLNGDILFVNQALCDILGYGSPEELTGQKVQIRYRKAGDGEKFIRKLKENGSVNNYEAEYLSKDGRVLHFLESALLDGDVISGMLMDVTERKKMEEALRESEEKFHWAFMSSPAWVVISTVEKSRYLDVNDSFLQQTGFAKEEVVGKTSVELGIWADEQDRSRFIEMLKRGDAVRNQEVRRRRKSGEILTMLFSAEIIRFAGEMCLLSVSQDITERKKAEEKISEYAENLEKMVKKRTQELEDAKILAETASRAKSAFLANISHEFRTPLNSIIGFSEALVEGVYGELKPEHREYIKDIFQSGMHLLSLINQILDLSKIEAGKMELEYRECRVDKVIESTRFMFMEKVKKHGINFVVHTEEDTGTFEVDEMKVKQVLINLISNALKFTPDGSSISVTARKVESEKIGDFIEISVEDTGEGIAQEDQERLFMPFEQLETGLSSNRQGTGLGLALCKRFVELHGGRIWAESQKGKGSRFVFVLPRRPLDDKLIE